MSVPSSEKTGRRIGHYEVISHLKTGGMGAVYRALDLERGREVALKVLSQEAAENPRRLERFRREAQHGVLLQHENIVTVYEFGEADGLHFLAMEFVDGTDLEEYVRKQGVLKPDDARRVLVQIAKALDYAHEQGVVHRDIKPSNILLTRRHGRLLVKVADLGLARGGVEEETRVTTDGSTVGTVDYMAPEQARDSRAADIRSDIYSLGCSLYHMLSGAPPFADGSLVERVVKHARAEPPDLRTVNPAVTDDLWAVCRRMLEKKPAQRYQSPAELLVDLENLSLPPAETAQQPTVIATGRSDDTSEAVAIPVDDEPVRAEPGKIAASQLEHGRQAVESGNYDYGITLLLAGCRLDPGNVEARRALRQAQLGRFETAVARPWRSWLSRWLCKGRFECARRWGTPQEVMRWGEELLTCDPRDLPTHLAVAEAAEAAGHRDAAIWMLEHAKGIATDDVPASRMLARLLADSGEIRRAIDLWQYVAERDPLDREARRQITDLSAHESTQSVYNDRKRPRPTPGVVSGDTDRLVM